MLAIYRYVAYLFSELHIPPFLYTPILAVT